jgi:hypothetical protein
LPQRRAVNGAVGVLAVELVPLVAVASPRARGKVFVAAAIIAGMLALLTLPLYGVGLIFIPLAVSYAAAARATAERTYRALAQAA